MYSCMYSQGSTIAVVSAEDLVKVLAVHPQMKELRCETATAYVLMETGAVKGLQRIVQAATAPSLGQQMLQRGSRSAIADGESREETSMSVDSGGNAVVERLVERGVLLPDGQGVQVQQAVQQVISADSELGKRKVGIDLEQAQVRRLNIESDKMQIENDYLQKTHAVDIISKTVNSFASMMEILDPSWRQTDKRLVLQATDYVKNGTLGASSTQQIENGDAQSSDSISISQVAFELGISLIGGKAIRAGKHAAKLYKDKYGESPTKHNQTVGGQVISVNSYTLRDRDLVESAIRGVV